MNRHGRRQWHWKLAWNEYLESQRPPEVVLGHYHFFSLYYCSSNGSYHYIAIFDRFVFLFNAFQRRIDCGRLDEIRCSACKRIYKKRPKNSGSQNVNYWQLIIITVIIMSHFIDYPTHQPNRMFSDHHPVPLLFKLIRVCVHTLINANFDTCIGTTIWLKYPRQWAKSLQFFKPVERVIYLRNQTKVATERTSDEPSHKSPTPDTVPCKNSQA